ncbi:MAG: AmmeMemoRadiSam system radical SAM enzyme [Cyclobacteriaceae bacterium]|nr:AmmeMemoRadiSam system radical SAM enzyme [Cyclobacteriaceae bacterium]
MREAKFYKTLGQEKVRCNLCPHLCIIEPGERGICGVRKNLDGHLKTENYGLVSAIHFDPVEKKPLYHFFPGKSILSFGSIGCNFTCGFCQNCDISQTTVDDYPWLNHYSIDQILNIAFSDDSSVGIAYTYNEPTIYFEFMFDIAREIEKARLRNVMISNGFITEEPLDELLPHIDAFNIDLKSFRNEFYKEQSGARLKPVKETLKKIRAAGKHLEITNLVIPTLNDQRDTFHEMLAWIRDELGEETILHLSRYFPAYQMTIPATPREVLNELYEIARSYLPFTYMGNINSDHGSDTFCPSCNNLLIERSGYSVRITGINENGDCSRCGMKVFKYYKK